MHTSERKAEFAKKLVRVGGSDAIALAVLLSCSRLVDDRGGLQAEDPRRIEILRGWAEGALWSALCRAKDDGLIESATYDEHEDTLQWRLAALPGAAQEMKEATPNAVKQGRL